MERWRSLKPGQWDTGFCSPELSLSFVRLRSFAVADWQRQRPVEAEPRGQFTSSRAWEREHWRDVSPFSIGHDHAQRIAVDAEGEAGGVQKAGEDFAHRRVFELEGHWLVEPRARVAELVAVEGDPCAGHF